MSEHWCLIHKEVFFKKGKMKNYAHPIEDGSGATVGWCNEEGEPQPLPEEHKAEVNQREISREESIEQHVWFKELGARIGDGSLERDYPKSHVKIKVQYYKRMSEITGINFKEG